MGDIVGKPGRQAIKTILPKWQKEHQPDLIIANGENTAHGLGINEKCLKELLDAGVDIITSGDHIWNQKGTAALLQNKTIPLIRPANLISKKSGRGYYLTNLRTKKVLVINLIGQMFMEGKITNPFKTIDKILEEQDEQADIIIIDFHAETTAEKVCLGWHLDGRVTAVLGTHTHIPTADARVLPKGTAYITDIGMVGIKDSSLGADKKTALDCLINEKKFKLKIPNGPVEVNAVLIETSPSGASTPPDRVNMAKKIKCLREIVQ